MSEPTQWDMMCDKEREQAFTEVIIKNQTLTAKVERLESTIDKLGKALKDAVEKIKNEAHDQLGGTRLLSSALKDIDETYGEALQLVRDSRTEVEQEKPYVYTKEEAKKYIDIGAQSLKDRDNFPRTPRA